MKFFIFIMCFYFVNTALCQMDDEPAKKFIYYCGSQSERENYKIHYKPSEVDIALRLDLHKFLKEPEKQAQKLNTNKDMLGKAKLLGSCQFISANDRRLKQKGCFSDEGIKLFSTDTHKICNQQFSSIAPSAVEEKKKNDEFIFYCGAAEERKKIKTKNNYSMSVRKDLHSLLRGPSTYLLTVKNKDPIVQLKAATACILAYQHATAINTQGCLADDGSYLSYTDVKSLCEKMISDLEKNKNL